MFYQNSKTSSGQPKTSLLDRGWAFTEAARGKLLRSISLFSVLFQKAVRDSRSPNPTSENWLAMLQVLPSILGRQMSITTRGYPKLKAGSSPSRFCNFVTGHCTDAAGCEGAALPAPANYSVSIFGFECGAVCMLSCSELPPKLLQAGGTGLFLRVCGPPASCIFLWLQRGHARELTALGRSGDVNGTVLVSASCRCAEKVGKNVVIPANACREVDLLKSPLRPQNPHETLQDYSSAIQFVHRDIKSANVLPGALGAPQGL